MCIRDRAEGATPRAARAASSSVGRRQVGRADDVAQERAGAEELLEVLAVRVAREPDLAALRGVQLRVVPEQSPGGLVATAARAADEVLDGIRRGNGQGHRLPPSSWPVPAPGPMIRVSTISTASSRRSRPAFARMTAMYGSTTAATRRTTETHTGIRSQSTTTSTKHTTRMPIWTRYRRVRRAMSSARGSAAVVIRCASPAVSYTHLRAHQTSHVLV